MKLIYTVTFLMLLSGCNIDNSYSNSLKDLQVQATHLGYDCRDVGLTWKACLMLLEGKSGWAHEPRLSP